MTYPKLICPIESVAKAVASRAWADARAAALDAGHSVAEAIYLADVARADRLAQMQPMIDAYNLQHGVQS